MNLRDLQVDLTPEKLLVPHASHPWNPLIANVLYRAGVIERWGRGTLDIVDWCRDISAPNPSWSEQTGNVHITFFPAPDFVTTEVTTEVTRLLSFCLTPRSRQEMQELLGLKNSEHFRKFYLQPAIQNKYLEMTVPDKPRSRHQRYLTTVLGRSIIGK